MTTSSDEVLHIRTEISVIEMFRVGALPVIAVVANKSGGLLKVDFVRDPVGVTPLLAPVGHSAVTVGACAFPAPAPCIHVLDLFSVKINTRPVAGL